MAGKARFGYQRQAAGVRGSVAQSKRIFSWRVATTAAGSAAPGILVALATSDPLMAGIATALGGAAGNIGSDTIYNALNRLRSGQPQLSPTVIEMSAHKMRQDYKHSIIHDRQRVLGAASEAFRRYEVVGDARGRPLISMPPPRTITLPSPVIHGTRHPKRVKTPEAREIVDAARRVRLYINRELKAPINIVSASINVGFNLAVASMARNYDLELDLFTQSRTGVEELQQLISPATVEFHFGMLPEGPLFFAEDAKVNQYDRLVPFFFELQQALCRTPQSNTTRRRQVFYFADSSSEEQFRYLYAGRKRLEGRPIAYLDELVEIARSGLDPHDWIILWEPLSGSLIRQSRDVRARGCTMSNPIRFRSSSGSWRPSRYRRARPTLCVTLFMCFRRNGITSLPVTRRPSRCWDVRTLC